MRKTARLGHALLGVMDCRRLRSPGRSEKEAQADENPSNLLSLSFLNVNDRAGALLGRAGSLSLTQ